MMVVVHCIMDRDTKQAHHVYLCKKYIPRISVNNTLPEVFIYNVSM
jgi:hypothetical protein